MLSSKLAVACGPFGTRSGRARMAAPNKTTKPRMTVRCRDGTLDPRIGARVRRSGSPSGLGSCLFVRERHHPSTARSACPKYGDLRGLERNPRRFRRGAAVNPNLDLASSHPDGCVRGSIEEGDLGLRALEPRGWPHPDGGLARVPHRVREP